MSPSPFHALDTLSDNPPDSNCSSIPSPCGWNATCNDTEEGPVCYCDIGYWINNITYDCESKFPLEVFTSAPWCNMLFSVCPWGTWGEDCAYECNCTNLDNTTTCHHVNGSCPDDGKTQCKVFSPHDYYWLFLLKVFSTVMTILVKRVPCVGMSMTHMNATAHQDISL